MSRCVRFAVFFVATNFLATGITLSQLTAGIDDFSRVSSLVSKREFRGAWIATVLNLDWPVFGATGVSQQQKDALVSILDKLAAVGFNAVVFQVRTECDALYNSPYDPWSVWLTGTQGTPPSPLYDPLEFAVTEAHKRGMELHAWFNPYRAERSVDNYPLASNHVTVLHPTWAIQIGTFKFLNPGLQEVRDYVATVVSDIVRRYDVDGVHADDYFYPYPPNQITHQDTATFNAYPRGISNINDWRRDNVNLLIGQIHDSVQAIKPHVKFGMSPFGIWKTGVPGGIFGLDAYSTIYCDAIAWLQRKHVDYITPQLYWAFGGGQDYGSLQPWWADSANANGRHLYTGNATYHIADTFSPTEISKQINFNRANPKVQGSVQFRALSVTDNIGGNYDLLKSDVFLYASIIPPMSWKPDGITPNAPSSLLSSNPSTNVYNLQWTAPSPASDGDTAARYAVYRFAMQTPQQSDLDNGKNLLNVVGQRSVNLRSIVDTVGVQFFYGVTSLDRNNNESSLSNIVSVAGPNPTQPVLASPANGDQNFPRGGSIRWNGSPNATAYRLEFDSTSNFGPTSMFILSNVNDTAFVPNGLGAGRTYFWRISAGNQIGTSGYSATFSFKTGWPYPPTLVSPASGTTNVPRNPTFTFTPSTGTSFRLMVIDVSTSPTVTVLDTTVADTVVYISRSLAAFRLYDWKVSAINVSGASDFSGSFRFRTMSGTLAEEGPALPEVYSLSQNYPNPFNPVTTIQVAVPFSGYVTVRVYDILGRDVATLAEEELTPGVHVFRFDGSSLPSGTYIYVLTTGETRIAKKMMLLK